MMLYVNELSLERKWGGFKNVGLSLFVLCTRSEIMEKVKASFENLMFNVITHVYVCITKGGEVSSCMQIDVNTKGKSFV